MAYKDSIVMNGYAQLGNLSGWDVQNVTLEGGVQKYFALTGNAFMSQEVAEVLFSETSVEYLFQFKYYRETPKDPINPNVDMKAQVIFRYKDGHRDVIELMASHHFGEWKSGSRKYQTYTDSELTNISIMVTSEDLQGVMQVDDIELLPSEQLINPPAPDDDRFENFEDKAILYGPEAALPVLGGDS